MADSCLPLVARPDARVLVLGSLPGQKSLEQHQYYAHPRNHFWPIMRQLLCLPEKADYADRIAGLLNHGIALWDVCAQAQRPGSLDSAIRDAVANDFPAFFAAHPHIALIACNGGKAFGLFQRLAAPRLAPRYRGMARHLPSTSPAHARLSCAQKLARWAVVRDVLRE